jgi:hypothetical protein
LNDCIEAGSSMNWFAGNNTLCTAVVFTNDIAYNNKIQHANCWLKYYAFVDGQNVANAAAAYLDNNGRSRK